MDFAKLIVELIENLKTVIIEEEGEDTATYYEPNEKALAVMKQIEQWQLDSLEETGVFYAIKYQADGGYDFGPFATLADALAVTPDTGMLLYRVDTTKDVEAGGSYFAEKMYVGGGEKWVKCDA